MKKKIKLRIFGNLSIKVEWHHIRIVVRIKFFDIVEILGLRD